MKKEIKIRIRIKSNKNSGEPWLDDWPGADFTLAMRIEIGLACAALWLVGCVHTKSPSEKLPSPDKKNPPQTYITPHLATVGHVEMVNAEGRFVVLSFPLGQVPPPGRHWRINHQGLTIGRVTITGPQREIDTVADIVEGQANVGDEAAPE
jgi:hypothetical protein